jgi:RNA polymerase sigma factor for flagellar operon FliA
LIEDAIVKLSAKLGRQPEEQEIAAELGLSLEQLYATAIRLDGLTLIGQEVCASYDRSEKTDLIESAPSREASPFDCCLHSEIKEQLAAAIETLSEKEQLVVSLYYKEELTMKEIAAVLRLGESRVCQLHAIALPKLRAALRKASFDETLL